jgi:hypothetical protein
LDETNISTPASSFQPRENRVIRAARLSRATKLEVPSEHIGPLFMPMGDLASREVVL